MDEDGRMYITRKQYVGCVQDIGKRIGDQDDDQEQQAEDNAEQIEHLLSLFSQADNTNRG